MTWDQEEATRAYAQAAFESLTAMLSRQAVPLTGAVVLDFGCGTGLLIERLVDQCDRIDGVDTSMAMLEVLTAKIACLKWTSVRTSTASPASGPKYDLVVCSSVCAFLDDYSGTVKDLVSRLKPGGLFVQWDRELNPDDEENMASPAGRSASASRARAWTFCRWTSASPFPSRTWS